MGRPRLKRGANVVVPTSLLELETDELDTTLLGADLELSTTHSPSLERAVEEQPPAEKPPVVVGNSLSMQTIKLGAVPTDISIPWGSTFDPSRCRVFTHRVSIAQNPTGHLSAPVFQGESPTMVRFRVVRDNTVVPVGSLYLGSYSDTHVGPAMQALHVFLLP